ncbi:intraflagellar transport protein 80 homolog [Diaphorina citri]|uniref:Intraflagellar transport protein 80 homolog n=2 Tax=Diaphorina citri TaxID=121845 RepID=A0A3Q0J3F6_DIACI|nr:intraflagellar transport protein 80 homolog [Diaphorina citri]
MEEKFAHIDNGATLVGRWSHDGAGILTAGEDGQVKIWSRNGLLRTTLISGGPPVYSAAWSPDSNKVLLTQAKSLVIKPLSPNNKATKWQAHDGLILKVAWCSSTDLILSGGEDCKYKVWDTDGRQLYSSLTHDHPISSLAWAPGGDMFAVGSYNTLRLCDKVGWSHSLDKPDTGSVYDLVWSNDATQIAGACANGSLLLGTIIQRKAPDGGPENNPTRVVVMLVITMIKVVIHIFDISSSSSSNVTAPLSHSHEITQLAVNQTGSLQERHVAFIDKNRDLYLSMVSTKGSNRRCHKLGGGRWSVLRCRDLKTSVSVSGGGDMFAVGSYNTLRLCDKVGWSHSLDKPDTGSVYDLVWSSDATQIAGACANGSLLLGTIIQRSKSSHCYVYNFNTPCIIELRDSNTSMILQAENDLKMRFQLESVSISSDVVLIRDQIDEKLIHIFDISSSSSSNVTAPLSHSHEITQLAVNQTGSLQERHVAFIDKNRDLYLSMLSTKGSNRRCHKLGIMVQSICWNTDVNILAAMQDSALCVWFFPAVVFADQGLLRKTVLLKDIGEFGKSPSIVSFVKNHLTIRRYDGTVINYPISPYISVLHSYAASHSWPQALSLCRTLNDDILWACLAGMATYSRDLATSEEAYAAIEQVDKVMYINHIKGIPVKAAQQAEMYLLGGNISEAESILLQHGLIFRAIQVSILTHNWDRALELALRHKTHIDTVLYQRKKYLDNLEKIETNEKFLRLQSEIELDEEKIEQKMAAELKLNA